MVKVQAPSSTASQVRTRLPARYARLGGAGPAPLASPHLSLARGHAVALRCKTPPPALPRPHSPAVARAT